MKKIQKLLKKVPRPVQSEDARRFNIDQVIKDVSTLVALSSVTADGGATRSTRILTGVTAALSVSSIGRHVYEYVQKTIHGGEYTLKLPEGDIMFQIAENWLMEALPDDKKLSVFVKSNIFSETPGSSQKTLRPRVTYDGSIEQEVEVRGHKVLVFTEQPDSESDQRQGPRKERTIVFTCTSAAARDAVKDELVKQAQDIFRTQPGLYMTRWGSFERHSDTPDRDLESVFLKEGQMDRIVTYLRTFLNNREEYDKLGIPFRTGLMFYGEPGTGKTSTATVLANELNMDIYYVNLREMSGDQDFSETISRVPANSIVLIEDIDAANAALDRDEDFGNEEFAQDVSVSCLLNILDGMQSPPGVIFILTTNKIEKLDSAILRPGRVDLKEELSALDTYQLRSMVSYFGGEKAEDVVVPELTPKDGITSADITQVVRKHLPNKEKYADAIIEYVGLQLLTKAQK